MGRTPVCKQWGCLFLYLPVNILKFMKFLVGVGPVKYITNILQRHMPWLLWHSEFCISMFVVKIKVLWRSFEFFKMCSRGNQWPVSLMIFLLRSKICSAVNWFVAIWWWLQLFHMDDSSVVVSCANFFIKNHIRIWNRVKSNFHQL